MDSLKDLSDTKLLFRFIQAVHHGNHVAQTPKALLKMQSKLDSFVKVACPTSQIDESTKGINASWVKQTTEAMQAHYSTLRNSVKSIIADRKFTPESFDNAWAGALRWARSSLHRKLSPHTIDTCRGICRSTALFTNNQPQAAQCPLEPSAPANPPPPTNPSPSQPNGDWEFVKFDRRYPKPTQSRSVQGPRDPLSNFYAFKFRYRSKDHKSVEHAYHMEKAQHFGHWQAWNDIWAAPSAHDAKATSNKYFKSRSFRDQCSKSPELSRLNKEWDRRKETLVLHLLRLKYVQCPVFASALRESGTKGLLHTVLDPWWGTGSREVEVIRGKNVFGRLLEQVRSEVLAPRTVAEVDRKQAAKPVSPSVPVELVGSRNGPPKVQKSTPLSLPGHVEPVPTRNNKRRRSSVGSSSKGADSSPSSLSPKRNRRDTTGPRPGSSPSVHSSELSALTLPTHSAISLVMSDFPPLTKPTPPTPSESTSSTSPSSSSAIPSSSSTRPATDLSVVTNPAPLAPSEPFSTSSSSPSPSSSPLPLSSSPLSSSIRTSPVLTTSTPASQSPPRSYSEALSSNPTSPLSRHLSFSQPCLTQFFGPKTGKVKFTEYKSTNNGEDYVMSKVHRIEAPRMNKTLWRLPPITKPILIIGDSNLSTIKSVKKELAEKIQIVSYPGANFGYLYDIFRAQNEPLPKVECLIMSIGINNRSQNAVATANKKITSLYYQAVKTFPNAKLFYPTIGNPLKAPSELQNLKDFEKHWRSFDSPSVTILPSISVIRTTDGIHWTPMTSRGLLNQWLDHLPLN